jgi:MFS family permease
MALIVAGVGTSMCFATVASAAIGSVPPQEVGVASGTNNALNQLGGVFGVAILAAVFTHQGGYGSPHAFVDGFAPALWVGAGVSALGIVAALLAPGRLRAEPVSPAIQPAPSLGDESPTTSDFAS